MIKDYYLGNNAYGFFLLMTMLIAIIAGFFTGNFSYVQIGMLCVYMIFQNVFQTYLRKNKSVSEREYSKIQIILLPIDSLIVSYAFENAYLFFFTLFVQSVIVLLFFDVEFCKFQIVIFMIMLFFLRMIEFPGIANKPKPEEYVFTAIALGIIIWIVVNLIGQIEFHSRRSLEREQSLDDLSKVVEVKCDEAREATRSKSEFLSNMSHEIRTPINAVLGMNEMILRESNDKQIMKYAANIESSGRMLLSLINDILDFSKIESNKMEIISTEYKLRNMLSDLINMLLPRAKGKDLQMMANVDPAIPNYLYGDEVRIRQILMNLLTNAIKYTDKGQIMITVTSKEVEQDTIALTVSVKDTGRGIKEEDLKKLFQSFQRVDQRRNRNIEGTGLGLVITQRFVEMMRGTIDVKSTYGEGSEFIVTIPQVVKRQEGVGDFDAFFKKGMVERESYHESFHAPNARVLVVDDNDMNLIVAKGLLKRTLIQVETAKSGEECLELLRKNQYHILFLDHMMPDMDGIETLQRIKQEKLDNDMPIVALTANVISGAKKIYSDYGFQDYLAKPIVVKELEKLICAWLPQELLEDVK